MFKFVLYSVVLAFLLNSNMADARDTLGSVRLDKKEIEILNNFHFVFVGGFMNELARHAYFQPLIKALHEQGIDDVSTIFPSSTTSVLDTNSDLASRLYKHYIKHNKPLIVIGHSMGGLRAVAVSIAHPELIEKQIIARAIAFQSPISGSSELQDHLEPFSRLNFWPYRGAYALTIDQVNLAIEDSFDELSDEEQELVSDAVRYIISNRHTDDMHHGLRRIYESVLRPQTLTDGLVDKYHMFHPDFGSVLLDVEADHMELVINNSILAGSNPKKQKAFIANLLKELSMDIRGDERRLSSRTEKLRIEREQQTSLEETFANCENLFAR